MKKPPTKAEREHMGRVAAMGCIICGQEACVHHIRTGQGMGQRASHFETIPLCQNHHQGRDGIHTLGRRRWEATFATELELLRRVREELGMRVAA